MPNTVERVNKCAMYELTTIKSQINVYYGSHMVLLLVVVFCGRNNHISNIRRDKKKDFCRRYFSRFYNIIYQLIINITSRNIFDWQTWLILLIFNNITKVLCIHTSLKVWCDNHRIFIIQNSVHYINDKKPQKIGQSKTAWFLEL